MQCINPFKLNHDGNEIPVNCGKCPPCLKRRVSHWAYRLVIESRARLSVPSFVTLTYAPQNMPITKNGFMTLEKRDLQLFFKRLRKANAQRYNIFEPIKYFAAGEYGTHTKRPHYHIIMFGAHHSAIPFAWSLDGSQLGHVHIGRVSEASIQYCLKYIHKKGLFKKHSRDDRKSEFQLFSKGLGKSYLNHNRISWHLADVGGRYYIPTTDGNKISMPRYYREKIYNDDQKLIIANAMQDLAIEKEYQQYLNGYNPDHLQTFLSQTEIHKKTLINKIDLL